MKYIPVEGIEHLKVLTANTSFVDGFIALIGGGKSSKQISWNGIKFWIFSLIDGTDDELTEEELYKESNIGEAIKRGNMYVEEKDKRH